MKRFARQGISLPTFIAAATLGVATVGLATIPGAPLREPPAHDHVAAGHVVVKRTLTLEGARVVLAAAIADAKRKNGTGAIAVVDDAGHLVCLEKLDGTFLVSPEISIGKARTAAVFKKPTADFERIIREGRTAMVALDGFTPLQGGVPIVVDGNVIGAIGVSGAASAAQDEEIAIAGAEALSELSNGSHARD